MIEEFGILKTKCIGLGSLPSGKRKLPRSKTFVVCLVCKGMSICSPPSSSYAHSKRKYCGYGIRFFALNKNPSHIFVEEFGTHYGESTNSWRVCPVNEDQSYLSLVAEKEAMSAFQTGLTPSKYLTKCAERAMLCGITNLDSTAFLEIKKCYRLQKVLS
tara:strand:- start:363 stop:839 length:477 start_codon:yes stop_codon:yes gene_type:complete